MLQGPAAAPAWLGKSGLVEIPRALHNFNAVRSLWADAPKDWDHSVARILPRTGDPDLALDQFSRWFAANAKSPLPQSPVPLLENKQRPLEAFLRVLGVSKIFGDHIVRHPESIQAFLNPVRRSPSVHELLLLIRSEVEAVSDEAGQIRVLRRFRMRQLLRVMINDIVRERPLEEVTRDISRIADAALEAALELAVRRLGPRFGKPQDIRGEPVHCCLLAMGKLGGEELNYSSDIDVMMVYSAEGETSGGRASISNAEYHARLINEMIKLVSAHSEEGTGWRIDLRLRPEGATGPLAKSLTSTLAYYDTQGRTWERQALIKVRAVAGNASLGRIFRQVIQEFVYRKYLSFAEISEIKSLKRRIERRSRTGAAGMDIKTGRGGIRDIEYTIQFLQLLNGGDLPEIRQRNTLTAMAALERHGCLTDQEYRVLDDSYRFLRKVEHRLQLVADLQTHRIPESEAARNRLARRMGHTDPLKGDPWLGFLDELRERTEPTFTILNHLVHQAFPDDHEQAEPETDLLLDPDPDPQSVRAVLARNGFRNLPTAHQNLLRLASEPNPFLSSRRARHFFSSIAPGLLRAISLTPEPDSTLAQLERITGSLGGKAGLWELFSFHAPSLKLMVDLSSGAKMLGEILLENPGMIDELLDALLLGHSRSMAELSQELDNLLKGADDPDLILRSFRDKELLGIGIREMTGGEGIDATSGAISDLAEVLLQAMAARNLASLEAAQGIPLLGSGPREGLPCRHALVGLGRLGARQMSYFSDLDLIWIYEGDNDPGSHGFLDSRAANSPDAYQWHAALAQGLVRASAKAGGQRPLFEIDMRLRPTGRSGSLALPLSGFRHYHLGGGGGRLWEKLALTRARILGTPNDFTNEVAKSLREVLTGTPWQTSWVKEAMTMRQRLEASRTSVYPGSLLHGRDLKRSPGGMVDVEFVLELHQLKSGASHPEILGTNTFQSLSRLGETGLIDKARIKAMLDDYSHLSRVQNRVRLLFNRGLDVLPDSPGWLDLLGRQFGLTKGQDLQASVLNAMTRIRENYELSMAELES